MLFRVLTLSLGYLCSQHPPPLSNPGWPPGISIFLPWMANSRGWGLLSVKSPGVGTQKEGKCPVHRQHCNIFHWPHSRVVTFKHFNVRFFVSLNIFLCNSPILIKTYVSDHQSLQWNVCAHVTQLVIFSVIWSSLLIWATCGALLHVGWFISFSE